MVTVNLKQISEAIENCEEIENSKKAPVITGIRNAAESIADVLDVMDKIPITGIKTMDMFFGCVMALQDIIGTEGE